MEKNYLLELLESDTYIDNTGLLQCPLSPIASNLASPTRIQTYPQKTFVVNRQNLYGRTYNTSTNKIEKNIQLFYHLMSRYWFQ